MPSPVFLAIIAASVGVVVIALVGLSAHPLIERDPTAEYGAVRAVKRRRAAAFAALDALDEAAASLGHIDLAHRAGPAAWAAQRADVAAAANVSIIMSVLTLARRYVDCRDEGQHSWSTVGAMLDALPAVVVRDAQRCAAPGVLATFRRCPVRPAAAAPRIATSSEAAGETEVDALVATAADMARYAANSVRWVDPSRDTAERVLGLARRVAALIGERPAVRDSQYLS